MKKTWFGMPAQNGCIAYPEGPYRFINREYLIISYETDFERLKAVVPAPLIVTSNIVKYEFIRMPDSSGFGDYTETGQVIPVEFEGQSGGYVHSMFLDVHSPIAAGREIWGFPKKLAQPKLVVEGDDLKGLLHYGSSKVAEAHMGFKYQSIDPATIKQEMHKPGFLVKMIPHVDGTPRICELVRYHLTEVDIKGAWTGPASLELFPHSLAPVADLPVRRILSAVHFISDLTLPYGEVVHDYLKTQA